MYAGYINYEFPFRVAKRALQNIAYTQEVLGLIELRTIGLDYVKYSFVLLNIWKTYKINKPLPLFTPLMCF